MFSVSGSNGTRVFSIPTEFVRFPSLGTLVKIFLPFLTELTFVAFGSACVELISSSNVGEIVVDSFFEFPPFTRLFMMRLGNSKPGSVGSSVSTFGNSTSFLFGETDSFVATVFEVVDRKPVLPSKGAAFVLSATSFSSSVPTGLLMVIVVSVTLGE